MQTPLTWIIVGIEILSLAVVTGQERPVAAYSESNWIYLTRKDGSVLRRVHLGVPLSSFAVSPDATLIAGIEMSRHGYGGQIHLFDTRLNRLRSLVGRPFWGPVAESDDELYADPEFAPDGQSIAFAIRHIPRSGSVDLFEAAGPIAVLEFASSRATVLAPTLKVSNGWPAFANGPRWSPGGDKLLISFETGFGVADPAGKSIWIPEEAPNTPWSTALGWLGPDCFLSGIGENGHVQRTEVWRVGAKAPYAQGQSKPSTAPWAGRGVESISATEEFLLVSRANECRLYDRRTMQVLAKLPRSAKLVGRPASVSGSTTGCLGMIR